MGEVSQWQELRRESRISCGKKCEKGLLQGLPENLTHPERLGRSPPPLEAASPDFDFPTAPWLCSGSGFTVLYTGQTED